MSNTRQFELTVEGMSCQHCVATVSKIVEAHAADKPVKPVQLKFVDLDSGVVTLEVWEQFDRREMDALIEDIEAQGYDVVDVHEASETV